MRQPSAWQITKAILAGRIGARAMGKYDESNHGAWVRGGRSSISGATVTAESATATSAVFACGRLIAGCLAMLPLITYRRLERGKERAFRHPLYSLLHDAPNEEQTSLEWREMLQWHLLLRGNAYNAIEYGRDGYPNRIVPLHPDRVRHDRESTGELFYLWTPKAGGERRFYPRRGEINHLRVGLSNDGVTGIGIVEAARESIGMALTMEEYAGRLFASGATFKGILKYPGAFKNPDLRESLKKDFHAKSHGMEATGQTIILENGMDWVSVGMKAADAEFLEQRKFQISDVARWFLVPPHMIGDVDRSTSWGTGIEAQAQGFLNFTMGYWFELWEQCIVRDLVPREERAEIFPEFLYEGFLRGDTAARGEFYTKMFNLGAYSPNDILELENRNPYPDGDRRFVPLNMVPADKVDEYLEKLAAKKSGSNGGSGNENQ